MNLAPFASQEWLNQLKEICNTHDPDNCQKAEDLKEISINYEVKDDQDNVITTIALKEGFIRPYKDDNAQVTLKIPKDAAKIFLVDYCFADGVNTIMSGKVDIDGDVTKLMNVQSATPTVDQIRFMQAVQSMTEEHYEWPQPRPVEELKQEAMEELEEFERKKKNGELEEES